MAYPARARAVVSHCKPSFSVVVLVRVVTPVGGAVGGTATCVANWLVLALPPIHAQSVSSPKTIWAIWKFKPNVAPAAKSPRALLPKPVGRKPCESALATAD